MGCKQWFQSGFIYLLILVAIAALFFNLFQQPRQRDSIPISKAAQDVQLGSVRMISAAGTTLTLTYKDGTSAITTKANRDVSVEETLRNLGVAPDKISQVDIVYEQPAQWGDILTILSGFLPLIFVGALFFFLFRQVSSGSQATKNVFRHAWNIEFAATNRSDLLDPALLRAGRLETQISIGLPNEDDRLEILKILTRGKLLAQDVRLDEIARQTPGRTGADLASIVNQAAIIALKGDPAKNGRAITQDDLEQGRHRLSVTA